MHDEMPRVTTHSNGGREWTGLKAELLDTGGGALEFIPSVEHHISMHVGGPVRAHCRCDGRSHRRLQIVGDIDIIPLGCPVRWEDDGPTRVLSLHLHPSLLKNAAEEMGMRSERLDLVPQMQIRDPRLQHVCWAIVAELEDGDPAWRLYGESLALALAGHLVQHYCRREPKASPRLSRRQVQTLVDYISENLGHSISIADLSALAGVSPSHFKALFKRTMGVPVHQFVVRRRVDTAVELLAKGDAANQVATHVGFADQSHMARWMRRMLGVTPREIQR